MDARLQAVLKENEQALAELVELFKTGSVIPFVGAGMSASFYPGWGKFLLQEAQRVGCKTAVAALLKAGKYEEAAEELARKRRGLAFEDMMGQQFSPRSLEGTEIGGAVALLPRLARGCVITLNFDRVLETVFERAGLGFEQVVPGAAIVASYQNALTLNRRYLLKVHGDVEDATNRVLTLREYRRSYGTGTKPAALLLLLQRAATLGRLLFLGCSLNKDRFMKALRAARKATPGLRCGFAIVQKPRNPPAFARRVELLSAHGITPIWYAEGQYEDVAVLLHWLLERIQGSSTERGEWGEIADKVEALLRDYGREFAGRNSEMAVLDGYLASQSRTPLLIAGPAGFGKTALMAKWLERKKAEGVCTVYHFFSQRSGLTTVRDAYLNLLRQVPGQVASGELPGDASERSLRAALYDALQQWKGRDRKSLLVIIEGLDEADAAVPPFPALPPGVRVVASARADTEALRIWADGSEVFSLAGLSRDDVRRWLSVAGDGQLAVLAADDDFVARLDRATQGLALYLRYLVDDLLTTVKAGRATATTVQLTPKKFSGYVREQMQILARDVFAKELKREALRKLFAVLAVAVAELPEDDVCALTGFDVFDLLNLPWAITRWFTRRSDPDSGKMAYAFAHPLLAREFGIALGPLAVAARGDLLQFCSRWQENGSRFAVQHYAGQLAEANCGGDLFALARDRAYLSAQEQSFPGQPGLPLTTLRHALSQAARTDDAAAMAEFMLRHGREVYAITARESPLDALRAGSLERACELADLFAPGLRALWHLLLAWELMDSGRREEALAVAKMILKGRGGVLNEWQYECAAHLLPEVWELGAGTSTELFKHLFPVDEEGTPVQVRAAYNEVIIALVIRRHYDAALTIGAPFFWRGPENILAMVARCQARDGDYYAALRSIEKISKLPLKVRALADAGLALAQTGKREDVRPCFRLALGWARRITDRPDHIEALRKIAVQQAKAGEIEGAIATERKMAEAPSETADHSEAVRAHVLAEIAEAEHHAGSEPGPTLRRAANYARKSRVDASAEVSVKALLRVAVAWARVGKEAEAAAIFGEVADDSRTHPSTDSGRDLAVAQAEAGDLAAALLTSETIDNPNSRRRALAAIAVEIAAAGRIDEALAIVHDLDAKPAFVQIGLFADPPRRAREILASCLANGRAESRIAEALSRIALAQARAGDFEAADATVGSITDADQRDDTQAQLADLAAGMGRFEQALERAGAVADDQWELPRLLKSIAVRLARAHQATEAFAVVERITHDRAQNVAYAEMAAALAEVGDLDAAQDSLRRHQTDGYYSETYCEAAAGIALLHAKSGQVERAFQAFQALPDSKFTAPTLGAIARALTGTQEAGRAAGVAGALIKPERRAAALAEIAVVQCETGQRTAALATFERAAAALRDVAESERPSLWIAIGDAQLRAGYPEDARRSFDRCLERADHDDRNRQEIVHAYAECGDFAAACRELARFESPYGRAEALGAISRKDAFPGFGELILQIEPQLAILRETWIPTLAATLADTGDRANFKRLLPAAAEYLNAALEVCGSLAVLYPEQAAAIAGVVRQFEHPA
jgi:tetratricopeptide (TPR) repeat protein